MTASTLNPAAPTDGASVHAPHPPLGAYYAGAHEKRGFVTDIFDETASDYDKVETWFSLGSGRKYRRDALIRAGLRRGMSTADVGVGTGLVARETLAIIGATGTLVGIDPSAAMLRRASEGLGIETVLATAESLPFAEASFDFLSMGYALRHVEDLAAALREFHRVLKPGGRVCVMEITPPRTRIGRALFHVYFGALVRIMGRIATLSPRTPELWKYFRETIDRCVPPARILRALEDAGFTGVNRSVLFGIFSEYTASKP